MPDMLNMTLTEAKEQIDRKNNPNFIIVERDKIQKAIDENLITKIGESKSKNGNIYYEINNRYVWNSVLMHIKDDKHIIINALIKSENRILDLVSVLMNYSFCVKTFGGYNRRERVVWNVNKKHNHFNIKQIPVERIIASHMRYGELRELPSYMHLHHKAQTWDNREATTMYIHEQFHKHRKRHLSGRYINSLESFIKLLDDIEKNEKYYKGVTEVE